MAIEAETCYVIDKVLNQETSFKSFTVAVTWETVYQ
jgi:hypothetical protein